ncbi:O-methyltransferase family protein [Klebsormidium nitens]|uniref:O-methyltransferase family protein n=1 Tax=Klebsormidium nitens TaxID=105231 RepID=A0A1Y1I4N7_KLENI|nr:O-methyltransferase family protein [Klebsormidium nitens]|eukprot:GAQ83697.1 O-methyltransferase family protein [Klebsormidium nitens]
MSRDPEPEIKFWSLFSIPALPGISASSPSSKKLEIKKTQAGTMAPALPAAALLADYAFSYAKGKVLYAAVENGLPDIFAKQGEPMSPDDVAQLAGTDPDATARLIRAMSGLGVLDENAEGTYSLSSVGQLLASDKETGKMNPLAGLILHFNEPNTWNTWNELSRTIKEGGSGWEKTQESKTHESMWDFFQAHPDTSGKAFDAAMSGLSSTQVPQLLQAYDGFKDMDELMDVAGGHGSVLAAITAKYPNIKGINFDQPRVIQTAPSIPGVDHVSGDMFKAETLPKASNIMMKIRVHILHDWGNTASKTILASCRNALPAGGKLLIVDFVIPNPGTAPSEARQFPVLLDIQMMMMCPGGRERSEQEWKTLLESEGFEISRIVPLGPGSPSVVEAVKA